MGMFLSLSHDATSQTSRELHVNLNLFHIRLMSHVPDVVSEEKFMCQLPNELDPHGPILIYTFEI